MDGFGYQLATDAAEAEGCAPTRSASSTPDETDITFSSMFGFATQWGKKLQSDLQLTTLVGQLKQQSASVTQAYTQDIAEFAQAVKTGATRSIDTLSTQLHRLSTNDTAPADRATRLLRSVGADLEDLLRSALVIEAPQSTREEKEQARQLVYDRRMAQLAKIRESTDTFTEHPESAEYDTFARAFSVEERRGEIDELRKDEKMKEMMAKLVPEQVEEDVFWTRYFFHVKRVEQEEMRRKKLVEDAVAATADEEFSWDMDDDDVDKSIDVDKADDVDKSKAGVAKDGVSDDVDKSKANDADKSSDTEKDIGPAEEPTDKSKTEEPKADDPKLTEPKPDETKSSAPNAEKPDDDSWDSWE